MSADEEKRAKAVAQLSSKNPHDRYLAAKVLRAIGTEDDILELMNAKRAESDSATIRWLSYAIAACAKRAREQTREYGPIEPVAESSVVQSVRAQAVEWIAGILLHEIGGKIGLLGSTARREIADYDASRTAKHIEDLELIFEGILQLRKAANAPKMAEFDLAQLIENIVHVEIGEKEVDVSLVGRKPLILFSDGSLLRLALCNGIRNAIEAVLQLSEPQSHGIVINWGVTDAEFWVSVIDRGAGLVPGESAFDIGRTTKSGHAGFGLAIARQAMEKLEGSVTLFPSAAGGAAYEIRGRLVQ